MHVFLCHSSTQSDFVTRTKGYLEQQVDAWCYEKPEEEEKNADWVERVNENLNRSDAMVIFVDDAYAEAQHQRDEANWAARQKEYLVLIVGLRGVTSAEDLPRELPFRLGGRTFLKAPTGEWDPLQCAQTILESLGVPSSIFGLPSDPHLFSYEKDIIGFYTSPPEDAQVKVSRGCPEHWPEVTDLSNKSHDTDGKWALFRRSKEAEANANPLKKKIGDFRDRSAAVEAAALGTFERKGALTFPEAGPRARLVYPTLRANELTVGIAVSGGIAPGINAVLDGIVQRHSKYAEKKDYTLKIQGYRDGLYPLSLGAAPQQGEHFYKLCAGDPPDQHSLGTSEHAHEGGSIIGTHRLGELLKRDTRSETLTRILRNLRGVDILYLIGGDGSMKAAHALWTQARQRNQRPYSVVAIPKTMDNDILWVWQAFGFLSAVEKARETVELLSTEVRSNPRLCVLQLFGSDSGFVVSHAVLSSSAGHCQLALIPEVDFSMIGIARYLKQRICEKRRPIPEALVVMAETAIPLDVRCYLGEKEALSTLADLGLSEGEMSTVASFNPDENPEKLGLSKDERAALHEFSRLREADRRIEGQTSDALRTAGLKLVMRVLPELLENAECRAGFRPEWDKLRTFSNEPRHLLRAIQPSTTDIIMGQRLGMLAVDNAMAGYTDFMISQWLTEFVLVPLPLVVLGRKRIPDKGIFWKSVLAKTGQPDDLVSPWPGTGTGSSSGE